jgi:hypothetical protein
MLTVKEKLARKIAKADKTFGSYSWETLPAPVRTVYLDIAENRLNEESLQLSMDDAIAAQSWGGDIDLVSF